MQSAQPKIQRMCEEESDDSEAVAKLLEINDSIHRTIERYKLVKKGDLDAASKIPKGTLGTSTGVSKSADNELSLIDLGGDVEPSPNGISDSSAGPKTDSLEDDLLGLSIQDNHYGQGGGIALGFGANTSTSFSPAAVYPVSQNGGPGIPGPSLLSSTSQHSTAKLPTPNVSPQPQRISQTAKPNYDPFASLTSSQPSSQSVTPAPPLGQQRQQQADKQPLPSVDPFATLSSPAPRQSSPFQFQQQSTNTTGSASSSLFDFSQPTILPPQPHQPSQLSQQNNGTAVNEEWTFASSLPDQGNLPLANEVAVTNTAVNIAFTVSRRAGDDTSITIIARSSNNTAQPISEFTFQIAVTKVGSALIRIRCYQKQ